MQHLAGGQGRRDRDTAVDPGDLPVAWCRERGGNGREGDMPAPGAVPCHPVGLNARRYGPGPPEPDPAHLRDADLSVVAGQAAYVAGSNGDDPKALVLAGLAPGRPTGRVRRVEERLHRLREVPQRLLLDHLGACPQPVVFRTGGGELSALLQVAGRALAAGVPVRVLLDGEVPHVPGLRAVVPEHRLFLGGRGDHAVSGHANTLASATDISGEVKRRLLPCLTAGVSTPRS